MPTKLQFYQAVADKTIHALTLRSGNWVQFLDTAARLYKYPFQDQLMIHAQRPDATACAELEFWNEKFNRWVRKGSKGIALIDDSGSYPRLKYVFDVSDTEASLYRARPVQLWEMTQEHKTLVISELARNYEDIESDGTLAEAFRSIAAQLAHEYYEDNYREILYSTENSILEPPTHYDFAGTAIEDIDDTALRAAFEEVLAGSIAYTVMARCGLDVTEEFEPSDFQRVTEFNTPDMVHAIGVATAELSEQVLRDIEITIRKYERVKNAERSEQSHDRNPYLHNAGRLSAPEHQTERTAAGGNNTPRQIREDEESVPQRPQEDNVQQTPVIGETVPTSEGSGRSGEPEVRADNDRSDGADQLAGQSSRPDEVDGGDEHAESASGGSDTERTDSRIESNEPPEPPPLSQLETTPISEIISTSPVSMDEVDSILRDGGNYANHKLSDMPFQSRSSLRIAAYFSKGMGDNADYLKQEYLTGIYGRDITESGKGFDFGNHRVCAWYTEDGIDLAIGSTAKNNIHRITIPWDSAADRIEELMHEGRYITRDAYDNAINNERLELASKIWFFYRDDFGGVPDEYSSERGGHPEDLALIKSLLDDPNERQAICDRLEADVAEYRSNLENRTWHNLSRLLDDMNAAMRPHVMFPNDEFEAKRPFSYFITQDEIDSLLASRGGAYSEGKFRFISFFLGDHSEKEKIDFVKDQYGHGGGTWEQTDGWQNATPGKGLTITRGGISRSDAEINLKWPAVIKRIEQLIQNGQYVTQAELDRIPNYERLMLMRQLNAFFRDLPEDYDRPFEGLDFHYPHEAEWEALRDLLDNPERVDALLATMEPIFTNTPTEDRYYDTRKAAWDNLNAYHDGEYTLFPGLENLPEPGSVTARRWNDPPLTSNTRQSVIDLSESPSNGDFSFTPVETVQMNLFDVSPLPILPSVEEQRAIIDDTLQQEAENAEANANEPFLNISEADKERIAAQFTTAPRSREAVELVKEVYGDSLNMPLPQAIKRITELVNEGKFQTAAPEPRTELTLHKMGDFYELRGMVAADIAPLLGFALIERGGEQITGFPANRLDGITQTLTEAGYGITLSDETITEVAEQAVTDGKRAYTVGDIVWLDDRRFSIASIGEHYKQPDDLDRRFGTFGRNINLHDLTSGYPIGRVMYQAELDYKLGLDERNAHLLPLGEPPEPAQEEQPPIEENVSETVSDPYALFEKVREELSKRGFAASGELVEDGINEYNAHSGKGNFQDVADYIENEFLKPELEFDFDKIAEEIYEQVLNDSEFREVLDNATSRGALRRPLNAALDAVIAGYESEQAMYEYLSGDDVADNLFDFIYRKAWDECPQEQTQDVPVASEPPPTPETPEGWTEITDPAELAEIQAIFGDDKPQHSYIVGQRVVLDLNERIGVQTSISNAGEFVVTKVHGDIIGVTIDNGKTGMEKSEITWDLTSAEVKQYTVKPVAELLYE